MAKYKQADGTEVDLGNDITDAQVKAISTIASDAVAASAATLTESLKTQIEGAIKPLSEQLAKVGQGEPEGDEPKGKPKAKGGDEDPVAAALAKLNERLDKADKEKADELQSRSTAQRVDAYLAKNHPNAHPDRLKILRQRALAAAPKDDAGMKSCCDDTFAEWKALGIDPAKALSASPAAEGAKASDPSADQVAEQKRKNMERLRKEGPGGLRPAAK